MVEQRKKPVMGRLEPARDGRDGASDGMWRARAATGADSGGFGAIFRPGWMGETEWGRFIKIRACFSKKKKK